MHRETHRRQLTQEATTLICGEVKCHPRLMKGKSHLIRVYCRRRRGFRPTILLPLNFPVLVATSCESGAQEKRSTIRNGVRCRDTDHIRKIKDSRGRTDLQPLASLRADDRPDLWLDQDSLLHKHHWYGHISCLRQALRR